jgi:hypothetical protein
VSISIDPIIEADSAASMKFGHADSPAWAGRRRYDAVRLGR